jgi:hypothetical protein
MTLKGLTQEENELLAVLAVMRPWGKDRLGHQTAKYLDGDAAALDTTPTLKAKLDTALKSYRDQK